MEIISAGPVPNSATPLPADSNAHTSIFELSDGVKQEPFEQFTASMEAQPKQLKLENHDDHPLPGSIDTPVHVPVFNHFQSSNVRGSISERAFVDTITNNGLAYGPELTGNSSSMYDGSDMQYTNDPQNDFAQYHAQADTLTLDDPFTEDGTQTHTQFTTEADEEEENHEPMKAYAKLCLPDGDYYVTSHQVIVGRDLEFWRQYMREKKHADRAQKALDEYALEPSQPSQPDDGEINRGPSSRSSQSLVGRPAKGLPSNYSEQGGGVFYPHVSDDEEEDTRRLRRKRKMMKSSASSTSVAPANLHPSMSAELGLSTSQGTDSEAAKESSPPQMLYIHPSDPKDIRLISKEHLLFEYNVEEEKWELTILGNRAFVNNELYQKNAKLTLCHEDEIIITSVSMYFKLPETRHSPVPSTGSSVLSDAADELEDEDFETLSNETPSRRRSNVMKNQFSDDDDESDNDEDDENGTTAGKASNQKVKIKLNFKKKASEDTRGGLGKDKSSKQGTKGSKRVAEVTSPGTSPEASRKPEKGKRPHEPTVSTTEVSDTAAPELSLQSAEGVDLTKIQEALRDNEVTPAMPPPPQPVIEPGSIFEGVAAEELPQKRKGPGRPPKNGLISKRDQSFVKRKLKEYEKRGQAPPPMDELVSIVRAENKAKELAAKAAARGEAPPDLSVMPSIELDPTLANMARHEAGTVAEGDTKTSATPAEPIRKPSPKPKRVVKSPSPMRPESDYTEEDLKKPAVTYVHILDEVLRDHPTGKADLQEIYDRICKRYPYFKYRVSTAGWQSSVRHNLLQHDRFVENGRSGKGRLWTINFECPIDKEKKRRVTPPPRPQVAPMNGNFGHQFGQPNYNPSYGQPGGQQPFHAGSQQGTTTYYSPYAPPQAGQPGTPNATRPVNGVHPNQQNAGGHPQQMYQAHQANGGQPQAVPRAPSNPPQFQGIVDEIMRYRSRYLSRFQPESDSFKEHDDLFRNCTTYISNIFHGTSTTVEGALKTEEERRVYVDLEKIFARYQHLRGPPTGTPTAEGNGSATPQPAPVNTTTDGANGTAQSAQAGGDSQPQLHASTTNPNIATSGNISQGRPAASGTIQGQGNTSSTPLGPYANGTMANQTQNSAAVGQSGQQNTASSVNQNTTSVGTPGGIASVPQSLAVPNVSAAGQQANLATMQDSSSKQLGTSLASSTAGDISAGATMSTAAVSQNQTGMNAQRVAQAPVPNVAAALGGVNQPQSQPASTPQAQLSQGVPTVAPGTTNNGEVTFARGGPTTVGLDADQPMPDVALSTTQANGIQVPQAASLHDPKVPKLPINSAEQPIVIADNAESEVVADKNAAQGVKRVADDTAADTESNEVKRLKMTTA